MTKLGRINIITGSGAPLADKYGFSKVKAKHSPKGSIYVDGGAGKACIKTSASGVNSVWVVIGAQTA